MAANQICDSDHVNRLDFCASNKAQGALGTFFNVLPGFHINFKSIFNIDNNNNSINN